ncbi:MAG TPA: MGMT family protein [Candidatus Nanoarchaeia archaeon]|nr:MGMT family protein [Candidatus Nanoarchaeia archaeon]
MGRAGLKLEKINIMITPFQKRVYELTKQVPKGKVTSYSAIAKKLKSSPRAVGQALRVNPFAPVVPCHRVVKSDGSIGGFGGETCGKKIEEKIAMLRKEGVEIRQGKIDKKFFIPA